MNDSNTVEILDIDRQCGGCGGSGRVPSTNSMYGMGVCAACNGRRVVSDKTAAKKAAARVSRMAAFSARASEARDAARLAYPEATDILENYTGNNNFIASVGDKFARYGNLSATQAEAIVKTVERDEERAANTVPVVEGRGVVGGEILSKKERGDQYGDYYAITVRDDRGFTLWGRIPKAISDAEVGDKVVFTATLVKSDDDAGFGFFKRASKASVIS